MKIIGAILFFVLVLDVGLVAMFLDTPSFYGVGALLLLVGCYGSWHYFFTHTPPSSTLGFPVGDAVDVSDPDKPVRVPGANIPVSTLNLGTLAIGSQGSGKTESVLLGLSAAQKQMLPDTGHAIFDGKGDIDVYKKYTVCNGEVEHFFSTELAGSQTLNLFEGEPHDVIERMMTILIGSTASTSFYADNQRDVLMRVIPLLKSLTAPTNLRDLYVVLYQADAALALLRIAKLEHVDPVVINMFEQWIDSSDHNKRLNEIKGLLNRLFVFVNGPYSARLNAYRPDISVERIIEQRKRVYFHLPYTEFSVDVATAITEMFAVVARQRQLSGPERSSTFPLFFDDWGKFFYRGFSPFQARCRSANMPLLFAFQSYAQLEEVSATFAEQLDDMTATKIILRCLGEKTGNYAMRLIGEYERFELSASEFGARNSTSLQTRRVFRLGTRDLKALQAGEAYISTLVTHNGKTEGPLWKTRLLLPDFTGWQHIALPAARTHDEGEGLGFWEKYLDPASDGRRVDRAVARAKQYQAVIV